MITYPDEFFEMNDRYFVCRALDNRIGGFMIAEVARLLKENKNQFLSGFILPIPYRKKLVCMVLI